MNTVFIEGNTAAIKMNEKGNFCSFSLAENVSFKKDDEQVTETHWYNIVAFNNTAKFIERNVVPGDKVLIEGRLTTNSYEKDGQEITVLQIVAQNVRVTMRKQEK